MYKSPIEVFQDEMQYYFDNNIVEAVQRYDIQVDKDELLKALRYDRDQYEKGYADGKRDAFDKLTRCKDCDNCKHSYEEEDRDGYWRLYCLKKWDNKEGSLVFPYDCCDKFECK